jgi:hypothetical protein
LEALESRTLLSVTATYTLSGSTATLSDQTITANDTDESAILVTSGGDLTLNNVSVSTTGNTSSQDNSSFYGWNAGILVQASSSLTMTGGTVTTTGTGANGIFATGTDAVITLTDVTIDASADGGHGIMATQGGSITATNVDIVTAGKNSGATDRGSGTIIVNGGTITTTGADSPGIYSTGVITVDDATITATGSEAAVIEGSNSITLTDTDLSGALKRGVMIYQSMSGDAEGSTGTFAMTGGSLSAAAGPLFYVTNSTGIITLSGVDLTATSGTLLNAAAGSWGTSGSNGGTVTFTAYGETLVGDILADSISSITAALEDGTTLTGTVDSAAMSIDATSSWTATGDSVLTSLTNAGTVAFASAGLTDTVSGNYTQASTGTLSMVLGSTSSYDGLDVSGTATLDGILNVELADGFTPTVGQTFTILTRGSGSGSFDSLTSSSGLTYSVTYGGTAVTITVTGTGDDAAPTVATAASATPGTVTGATTALSVLGADDGGEANLTYTWTATTVPSGAAAPTLSANGTNAAKNATATFSQAGTYVFTATIADQGGQTVTSAVSVTVDQTCTSITISPTSVALLLNATQQFSATALDQFGDALSTQPTFTWSTTLGTISSSGLLTASAAGAGVVSATSGGVSGTSSFTVSAAPTVATAASATPNPVTGTTTALSVLGADEDDGEANLTYTWTITTVPSGAATPTFSTNGANAAKNTAATFRQAGDYVFRVTIADPNGLTATSAVSVTVDPTCTAIVLLPASATVVVGGTRQFSATATDQFGNAFATQPTFTWVTTLGTISASGLLTAPDQAGSGTVTVSYGSAISRSTVTVVASAAASTIGLFDPTTSWFHLRTTNSAGTDDYAFGYGAANAGWETLVGDWDGDGTTGVGLYDPSTSTFYLTNTLATGTAEYTFGYGVPNGGWTPLVGDWNGDGAMGVGLYDPSTSTFYLTSTLATGTAEYTFGYGVPNGGWTPLVGDWNGDDVTGVALFDPGASMFYLTNTLSTGTAQNTFGYGVPNGGWTPLVGDWNGDGSLGVGLVDPTASTFYLTNTLATGVAEYAFGYGETNGGWTPIVGDWNGDGGTGVGLYDAESSTFYLTNTLATGTGELAFSYGTADAGWIPLVGVWAATDTSSTSGDSSDALLDTLASSRSNEPSDSITAVDAVFASLV